MSFKFDGILSQFFLLMNSYWELNYLEYKLLTSVIKKFTSTFNLHLEEKIILSKMLKFALSF